MSGWAVVSHEAVTQQSDPWAVVDHKPTGSPGIPPTHSINKPPEFIRPSHPFGNEPSPPAERYLKSAVHAVGLPATPEEFAQRAHEEENKTIGQRLKETGQRVALTAVGGPLIGPNLPATGRTALKAGQEAVEAARATSQGSPTGALAHTIGAAGYAGATAAAPLLGEAPSQAGEQIGSGDVAGGLGTATPTLLPFAAHTLIPEAPPAPSTRALITAPEHVEALTGFLKTTKTDPHITASVALPEARAVAAKTGIDPASFQGRKGGEVVTGKNGIFHKAIQEHRAEYAALRKPALQEPMDTTPIAQAYLDKITPEMRTNAPEIAGRLEYEASKFADVKDGRVIGVKPQPLSQLDDFRIRLNNELDSYYQKSVDAQNRAQVEVKADEAARDAAADLVYKTVARKSNVPEQYIRDLQRRQGALIETRRDLTQAFNDASGQQGEAVAGSLKANPEKLLTLREKASHLYPSKRGLERSFVREVISPKPLELFNNRLRMMFGGLEQVQRGAGAIAAPTPPTPPTTKSLPGGYSIQVDEQAPLNFTRGETPGYATLNLSKDNQPIGRMDIGAHHYAGLDNAVEIKNVRIPSELQGQGHGTVFYQEAARYARKQGAEHIISDTHREPPAERMWQSLQRKYPEAVTYDTKTGRWQWDLTKESKGGIQTPQPPSSTPTTPSRLQGPERATAISAVMSQLKSGEISEREADAKIQRLTGGGGRKLIRFPQQPEVP